MLQCGKFIVVITGPTATGKTSLGVQVSKMLGGEVVSADSMQVYKRMDIGTAKPAPDEMQGIPHHMIDVAEPWEDYSVACFVKDAVICVDNILGRGKVPVIVGGSGLYVDSLIRGREFSAHANPALRKELEKRYDAVGGEAMLRELRELDEKSAEKLHANDKKRIVRAFEVIKSSGLLLSAHDDKEKTLPPRYNALKIALNFADRAVLYGKINSRVDNMIANGLADEVSSLLEMGVSRKCTAMQAIGYKEMAMALTGEVSMDEAIAKIKMESTRYAKRQLTWLRHKEDINWITWDDVPDIEKGAGMIRELMHEAK